MKFFFCDKRERKLYKTLKWIIENMSTKADLEALRVDMDGKLDAISTRLDLLSSGVPVDGVSFTQDEFDGVVSGFQALDDKVSAVQVKADSK